MGPLSAASAGEEITMTPQASVIRLRAGLLTAGVLMAVVAVLMLGAQQDTADVAEESMPLTFDTKPAADTKVVDDKSFWATVSEDEHERSALLREERKMKSILADTETEIPKVTKKAAVPKKKKKKAAAPKKKKKVAAPKKKKKAAAPKKKKKKKAAAPKKKKKKAAAPKKKKKKKKA